MLNTWDFHIARPEEWTTALAFWHDMLHGTELLDVHDYQLKQGCFPADGFWIASQDERIDAVLWVWPEPGGYAHVWPLRVAPALEEGLRMRCATLFWQAVRDHYSECSTSLFQTLIPASNHLDLLQMKDLGFRFLAEIEKYQLEISGIGKNINSEASLKFIQDSELAIFASLMQESFEGSLDVPELNALQLAEKRNDQGFDSTNDRFFIQHPQYGRIGIIVLQADGHTGLLRYIGIKPEYRRLGLAMHSIAQAILHLSSQGCRTVELRVDSRNTPARHLYQKMGFQQRFKEYMLIAQ